MNPVVPIGARRRQAGLTLVEVLVAMTLLTLLVVPALQALHSAFLGSEVHVSQSTLHYRLMARLEETLAEPFGALQSASGDPLTASSYSDPVATPERLLVFIAEYDLDNADKDGDPFTGVDDGVLWLRVAIEGGAQSLATLRSR